MSKMIKKWRWKKCEQKKNISKRSLNFFTMDEEISVDEEDGCWWRRGMWMTNMSINDGDEEKNVNERDEEKM